MHPVPPRPMIVLTLLMAPAWLLSACTGEAGAGGRWGGTVDTPANGAVVVANPERGMWTEEERWRLEEELRIGALESAGPDQLGSVADVAVDDAGRIYVLERQAREVRVFGSDGAHVRTFGSQGGGPGELESPNSLEWGPRGNLWVSDFGNRRYEVFDTAGNRVTSHPFTGTGFGFGNRWGSDGLLYDFAAIRQEGEFRQVVVRRRLEGEGRDAELPAVDTLDNPELEEGETEEFTLTRGDGRIRMRYPVPLAPRSREQLVPGAGWWLSDPGREYRLALIDFQGDTVRVVERKYEPVPVTEEARESVVGNLPEGIELAPDRIPAVHPPVADLEPTVGGGLWVRRQTAPDREGFDVFDREGRYLGEVASDVPLDRLRVSVMQEDALYGVLRDELDVPYVVRVGIRRP